METATRTSRSSGVPSWLLWSVVLIAAIPSIAILLLIEENWRGKRAWDHYRRQLEAKGEVIDWAAFCPPPVPDRQNIFEAPKMTEWFVGRGLNELSRELGMGRFYETSPAAGAGVVAEVTVVPEDAVINPEDADIILGYDAPCLTVSDAQGGQARPAEPRAEILLLIQMEDVPLTDAIENLAREARVKYVLDPKLGLRQIGPDGRCSEPSVTTRWTNVSAIQALSNLLANYNLQLKPDAWTGTARIMATGSNEVEVRADSALRLRLQQLIDSVIISRTNGLAGPTAKGSQDMLFFARPLNRVRPVRIIVRADKVPGTEEMAAFFPGNALAPNGTSGPLHVNDVDGTHFRVWAGRPVICSASDYLAWSDPFEHDFDIIRDALKRPFARMNGDYQHPEMIPIPNYVTIRMVAQVLSQRVQCELLLGKPGLALRDLSLSHDLSRLLEGKPAGRPITLAAAMINVAITGLYADTVGDGLRLRAWQPPQLEAIQAQLQEVNLIPQEVEALQCERAIQCRLFGQFKETGFGKFNTFALATNWSQIIKDPRQIMMVITPRSVIHQNMVVEAQMMEHVIQSFDPTNGIVSPDRAEQAGAEIRTMGKHFSPYTFLAALATLDYTRAARAVAQNQTSAGEALVACALERYCTANGKYPESLDALVPQFITTIPRDVVTGGSLKYHPTDGGQFVLYSVGWNETDEGGKIVMLADGKTIDSTKGDWVWPPYSTK